MTRLLRPLSDLALAIRDAFAPWTRIAIALVRVLWIPAAALIAFTWWLIQRERATSAARMEVRS